MDAPALARAEALLRRAVLRVAPGAHCPPASFSEAGATPWFEGADACLDTVASLVGGRRFLTAGFGGRWPALDTDGLVLAPGLPTAVGAEHREAPDADYWRDGDGVWRSAAGGAEQVLAFTAHARTPGRAFDLLWFGDSERFLLAGGELAVEDRFCRLRVAAGSGVLEHELIRRRRVDAAVVGGLPTEPGCGPARIEVRRAAALLPPGTWDDPARVLRAREGIEGADVEGVRLRLRLDGGKTVELEVAARPGGWRAQRRKGEWPYLALEISRVGADLWYAAELDPRIDPLRPGVRTRLAFDLVSDLVVLGRARSPSDIGH
jgi:hypothetical protein